MMHALKLAGLRLETKEAPDPLVELKTLFTGHHDEVKKLAEEVKKFDGWATEIERKFNRSRLGGGGQIGLVDEKDLQTEHKAIGAYIKAGLENELKDYSVGTDPQGGYVVMPQRSETMMKRLFNATPMRRLSRVITLDAADSWEEPVDPSDIGGTWVGETESRPETDSGSLGLLTIPVNEIYALQKVTQKLLDTSYLNIGQWIDGKIADKFARSEGLAFVSGDGVKKPRGFMSYAADSVATGDETRAWNVLQYVISGAATTVTADSLRDVYWSLKAGYRTNASWVMASSTANALDKLKDGNGDYLWRSGMTAGSPPLLLNAPVEFDENMPAIGAGLFPIAFGDFKVGYTIIDRLGLRPLRDPYTAKPHVLFYTYKRVGGGLSNSEAIKLLKVSAS
ncbi:phage major capsid protein [Mesorhizobium sp. M0700]|uniref:phage major capsid protein n=1 Tax=Mesorhizobium sp. M0700 TaxID=2956988 RepID=UPI003338FCA8